MNFDTTMDLLLIGWIACNLFISLILFRAWKISRRPKPIKILRDFNYEDANMIHREMDREMELLMLDLSEASPFDNSKHTYHRIMEHQHRIRDLDSIRIENHFNPDDLEFADDLEDDDTL